MATKPWNKDIKNQIDKQFSGLFKWKSILYNRHGYQYRANQVDCDVLKNLHLLIGYNSTLDKYIVWNVLAHNIEDEYIMRGYKTHTFAVNQKEAYDICMQNRDNTEFISSLYYSPIGWEENGHKVFEKALIMTPAALFRFCEDPFAYLLPDRADTGYQEFTRYSAPEFQHCEIITQNVNVFNYQQKICRERVACTQAKRNPYFREIVFKKYNPPHCVVCGNTVKAILEAAHVLAVKDGGDDSADNGICLCRNHHKLFDDGMIKVDLQNMTFTVSEDYIIDEMHLVVGRQYHLS